MYNLPKIGFRNVKPLELVVLLRASEDTDDALKIMADVRAYFQGMSLDFFPDKDYNHTFTSII